MFDNKLSHGQSQHILE